MQQVSDKIVLKKLDNQKEMMVAYDIVRQRYKEMSRENYFAQIAEMIDRSSFKMIGAYLDDEIVGVAGYWIQSMLYCGRYIQISSFVVDEEKRGYGIGTKIIKEIEKIGRENSCRIVALDSYTENTKSHALYFREDFHIRGFHFVKDLV